MLRFDTQRFSQCVRAELSRRPRGARGELEQIIPATSLWRLLQGCEPRVSHVLAVCHHFRWDLDQFITPRRRDWIIV